MPRQLPLAVLHSAALAVALTLTMTPPAIAQQPVAKQAITQKADAPISLTSLLTEMTDRDALARFPSPSYTSLQASSYDRKSTSIDNADTWFANADVNQYIREEVNSGRKEWVMMDASGPGAIVRIWSANPEGVMRVYLDDKPAPAIEAPMKDILGGKWKAPGTLSYEASKGWNLYLPIPYAKHCKVTSDKPGFYYHVNYRTYPAGTAVESFTMRAFDSAESALRAVAAAMSEDRRSMPLEIGPGSHGTGGTMDAGGVLSLELQAGSCAVTGITLTLDGDSTQEAEVEQRFRSCVLEAEFDGETTIWCPIADFFGSGVGVNEFSDWYRSVNFQGRMTCRWIMPYKKSGKLTIHNFGSKPATAGVTVSSKAWTWDARSMHFHAVWRDQYPIHAYGAKGTSDFNYVDIKGKGVYVGDVLSIMNPVKDWWGEGDEKIYVDGEKFPSHFGTGTEDYYGYAWCWPATFSKPFHAQTRSDGEALKNNWGRTVVTRSRSLDAIPFNTALSMNIEVWHWKECDVEYATTAYFYALPGAATNRQPDPAAAARPLVQAAPLPPPFAVKGAVELESMKVSTKSDGLEVAPQDGFGPELWSKGFQLWVKGRQPGDFVEFKLPAVGKTRVVLHATKSWDYGIVRFTINGKPAGPDVDLYSGKREVFATGPIDLGVFAPVDGSLTLRCELVGANPKSEATHSFFGLDCVVLEPVN